MSWSNVNLIFLREVRDQLRDRRTLFVIVVLPILLYPFLGMSLIQVAQFMREHPTSVLVVGGEDLETKPALFEEGRVAGKWFRDAAAADLLELTFGSPDQWSRESALEAVSDGQFEAALYFPADFAEHLAEFRRRLGEEDVDAEQIPRPEILYNSANEKSQIAGVRVEDVMHRWEEEIRRQQLVSAGVPQLAERPVDFSIEDIADEQHRDAAVWSKVFPFLLLIWALTGAFYPAVDLCAGEKERGTLETLLISPAERSEIVWGKLLTVMVFSCLTVVLNLISMGVTGLLVISQFADFGPPPVMSLMWLLVALIPVAALFSALCLALAAFARSTKEGQYYLMPVVLVTMPLVVLPMAPGVELTLGNSLIPVTGVVLLLRMMLEGNYLQAMPFIPPVVGVTLVGCLLAIRWAVDQFTSEAVLFRESERLDLGLWLKHLFRDRQETPTVAAAVACGVLILTIRFFLSFAVPAPQSFRNLAVLMVVTQLAVVLTPALLMTIMLTRSAKKTLLLNMPPVLTLPAAVLLAVSLHPAVKGLEQVMMKLYPINDGLAEGLSQIMSDAPSFWMLLAVFAVVPAFVEEIAFRGFILSGFRHLGHKWRAIVFTSVFFGMTHAIFQQSLIACLVGIVIGYLAVQTGSLLPAILYHMVHNSLALVMARWAESAAEPAAGLGWLFAEFGPEGYAFTWLGYAASAAVALAILWWLSRLPSPQSAEESLQEAIDHHVARSLAG